MFLDILARHNETYSFGLLVMLIIIIEVLVGVVTGVMSFYVCMRIGLQIIVNLLCLYITFLLIRIYEDAKTYNIIQEMRIVVKILFFFCHGLVSLGCFSSWIGLFQDLTYISDTIIKEVKEIQDTNKILQQGIISYRLYGKYNFCENFFALRNFPKEVFLLINDYIDGYVCSHVNISYDYDEKDFLFSLSMRDHHHDQHCDYKLFLYIMDDIHARNIPFTSSYSIRWFLWTVKTFTFQKSWWMSILKFKL